MEPGTQTEKILTELHWCFTFDQAEVCSGASGRKLRQTCVWCPKYQRDEKKEGNENEKDH